MCVQNDPVKRCHYVLISSILVFKFLTLYYVNARCEVIRDIYTEENMCAYVSVCVSERERERQKEKGSILYINKCFFWRARSKFALTYFISFFLLNRIFHSDNPRARQEEREKR